MRKCLIYCYKILIVSVKEEGVIIMNYVIFLIFIPLSLLIHEIGHAVGTVLSSDKHVHIYLGSRGKENKENFHIGRLHFHIQYAFSGFCKWGTGLNRRQRFISLIGGPLLSFIMMVAAALMLEFVPTGVGKTLLAGFAEVNLFLFVGTLTPFQLPQWFGEQFSFPSDGLQLLRLFREKKV